MSQTRRAALSALICAAALLGCTRDSAGVKQGGGGGGAIVGATLGKVLPGRKSKTADAASARPAPDLATRAANALAANPGPLIMVVFEAGQLAMIGGMVGENGAMRSYQTPEQRGFILRNGLLAGTRGFGRDLMAAQTAEVARLIRSGQAGSAPRLYTYLDGDGLERPLPVTCTVTPAGRVTQQGVSGLQVAEHCEGNGAVIDNSYLVGANGAILGSRQWVGPALGYVQIQQLRF